MSIHKPLDRGDPPPTRRELRVGVVIPQEGLEYGQLRAAWLEADEIGADTLFVWDHFIPQNGPRDEKHFECWTLLAAMAEVTERVHIGALVSANSFRNPNLLADMARTVDHISQGRAILGIGAGSSEADHVEYGYQFKPASERLTDLDANLAVIRSRLSRLIPPPLRGSIPLLIGGSTPRLLEIAARHADIWNCYGERESVARRNKALDDWCWRVGREPSSIERSVVVGRGQLGALDAYEQAGFTHLLCTARGPRIDFGALRALVAWRDARRRDA